MTLEDLDLLLDFVAWLDEVESADFVDYVIEGAAA